jgi:exonuclease SbcC
MKLESIHLHNIRSYEDETIDFPLGTTLFEGDIRSGKSTILYAIEFALFGLGSLRGTFLLRNEEKEGSVTLIFDIDGQEYEVFRELKRRGNSAHQSAEGYIQGPTFKSNLSATELKEKVLQILNFNESPDPRAQSVIYRYAIFTPQDEMKEVITKDVDKRLQTLRRAYRIEDYKIASLNASNMVRKINEKSLWLAGQTADLDEKIEELENARKALKFAANRLEPLKNDEKNQQFQLEKKRDHLRELREEKGKIEQIGVLIPDIKGQIEEKTKERDKNNFDIEKLNKKIFNEFLPAIAELKKVKQPTSVSREQLKIEQSELKVQMKDDEKIRGQLEERKRNFELLIKEKSCPVCKRDLEPEEFEDKLSHVEIEKEKLDKKIDESEKEGQNLEALMEKLRDFENAHELLRKFESQLKEADETVEDLRTSLPVKNKSIEYLQDKLMKAEAETAGLNELLRKLEVSEKEAQGLDDALKKIREELAGLENEIGNSKKTIAKLEEEISKKEAHIALKASLDEHKIWLSDYFIPTLENIEKHVMISINHRFNDQFQKWFHLLIEDAEIQVSVDEEFTPIIEQNGYEQDYFSLSGGEKTSVALAYRLALNTTVQEISTGMRSNLLILDEPTDGFSREQVFKIRDILNELSCPQVIIVSHERELESCSDQVYKVQRTHGLSSVSRVK